QYPVPAAAVAQGDGGEAAEHVLADRVVRGVRPVVRLDAVDESGAVGRIAVKILSADALLGACLLVGTRGQQDVDRGARDHVLIVVGVDGEMIADALLHEDGGPLHRDAAALVAMIEEIDAILRQHASHRRDAREAEHRQSPPRSGELPRAAPRIAAQLHPQPPPTPPVAPRAPSRVSNTWSRYEAEIGSRLKDMMGSAKCSRS